MDVLELLKEAGHAVKGNIAMIIGLILAGHVLVFIILYMMWQRVKDQPDFKEKLK